MTPKEEAKELMDKYSLLVPIEFGGMDKELAKKCAKIVCVQMIQESIGYFSIDRNKYWKKVKKEINKL